ncbi:MAG: hypothetical protein H6737_05105 [Alphaproteobacteria bacterium]|nr:hypothetical protein [Alphaproteobacteria bacterium]
MIFLATAMALEGRPMGDELPAPALDFRGEMAGRAFVTLPESGVSRGFALPRARFSAHLQGPYGAGIRLVTVAVRSGGQTGYIGIDGETFVPRVQIAEARLDAPSIGLAAAAGVVDDLWVGTHQPAWGLPEVAGEITLLSGVQDRADLGGWVSWTAPERRFSGSVAVTSGEGERRRERNNGIDTALMVTARPWVSDAGTLVIRAYGKEGSRGVEQARNHRLGGSVGLQHGYVHAGAMTMVGWGSAADGALDPLAVGGFARTGPKLPFVGFGRVDLLWADRDTAGSWSRIVWLGGGPRLPVKPDAPLWLGVGWQGSRFGPDAGPVAGVVSGSDMLFVQLSADITAKVALDGGKK